jgi:hypothetical protein
LLHHRRRYDAALVAAFITLCVTSLPELFRGIDSFADQAGWCGVGTYVRVRRDAMSGSAVGGFRIEEGADTVLSPDGAGGEDLVRGGGASSLARHGEAPSVR